MNWFQNWLCGYSYEEEIIEPENITPLIHEICYNQKLKVKINEMTFSKSYIDDNFVDCDKNEKIVQNMFDTWFEYSENQRKPKYFLFVAISKLSGDRRKPHDPEWFQTHLSSVRFHYVNKQLVPYRYSLHK